MSDLTPPRATAIACVHITVGGDSPFSNTSIAVTDPLPPAPAAPTGLTATTPEGTAGETSIDLAWTDNANNEDGFEIERCTGADCVDFDLIGAAAPNATSYSDAPLDLGTTYTYGIRANNAGGYSAYSNTASATTYTPPPPPPAPTAPSGLTATAAGQTQINLAWTDNADNEDVFIVERCTGAACTNFAQIATAAANATSYSNTGLTAGTTYRYRVAANNAGGDSPYSNIATATTASPPDSPPVARFDWTCTAKGGKQCSFNASRSSDDNTITSYSWTFGDGTTGTGVSVTHRYSSNGSRNVVLTVRDNATPTQGVGTASCSVANGTTGRCGAP